jgi:thioredoxin reductase (NADPH)
MLEANINSGAADKNPAPAVYDVAVLGAGPAGLTAALYTSRSLLSTLVIEKIGSGGQAAVTDLIENYPGFPNGINGFELSQKMDEQARKFGAHFESDVITGLRRNDDATFTVKTEGGVYNARTVIIATGASSRMLGVPGEDKFIGKGISFCATCDASFYRG